MKRFIMLILAAALMTITVCAETPRLVDNVGLLTPSEAADIEGILDGYSKEYDLDIAVLTSYGTEYGMSTRDYCEYFFENNYGVGAELDGVILYINMSEREWQIATSGKAITALTDYGLEYIEKLMIDDLSDGDYYSAFKVFADSCADLLSIAESGEPYDVQNGDDYADRGLVRDTRPGYPFGTNLLISLVFGFIAALVGVTGMKSQLKSVGMQRGTANYVKRGSFNITQSRDIYLYRNVTRTARPKETSSSHSSGGSTVHRSSSGHSFGGRGGRF